MVNKETSIDIFHARDFSSACFWSIAGSTQLKEFDGRSLCLSPKKVLSFRRLRKKRRIRRKQASSSRKLCKVVKDISGQQGSEGFHLNRLVSSPCCIVTGYGWRQHGRIMRLKRCATLPLWLHGFKEKWK
uniref:Ribosomal protein S14 n=1 Tax=Ditylenchus dipsaci TaxID=166011 RepID=A0A915EH07_9BILA